MMIEVIAERLAKLRKLHTGSHEARSRKMCAMEAVAYVAGEKWSDHPECACPVIGAFMRSWNDALPNGEDRNRLLIPLVPKLVGTRKDAETESRRTWMAVDWLTREHAVAWLRLAKLTTHADALTALPELTPTTWLAAKPTVDAAGAAAGAAARATGDAAGAASAAGDAGAAAGDAAGAAAWNAWAARAAARSAAWDAWAAGDAGDAAGAAAGDAWAALAPTVTALQASAVALVERMIAA